jgi:hypothetical protein
LSTRPVPRARQAARRVSNSVSGSGTGPSHKALRLKAQKGRKSLNDVLRDAPIREAEGTDVRERVYTDLDDLVGSWVDIPGFDDAIEAQDRVEEVLLR